MGCAALIAPGVEVILGTMSRGIAWVTLVVLSACGPNANPGEISIEVAPAPVSLDGRPSTVKVVATRSDGLIGSGSIKLKSTAGSLVEGTTLDLDAFGTALTPFSCNQSVDPECSGSVSLDAEWLVETVLVKASRQVSVGPPNTGGTGVGGTGGTGGTGGAGTMTCGPCTGTRNMYQFAAFGGADGRLVNFWFSKADRRIGAQNISGTELSIRRAACPGGNCTSIEVETGPIKLADGTLASSQYDIERHTVGFGGSMDVPQLRIGRYTDGKRQPPVPSQPYFDTNICPQGTVTTFEICNLEADGVGLNKLAMNFDFAICVGPQVERKMRGCVIYSR